MSYVELDKLIRDLLTIQEDRCAITGLPFQFRGAQTDDDMLPSLDRIDSSGHYAKGKRPPAPSERLRAGVRVLWCAGQKHSP
ncbi:hypothetical protein RPE78_12855 [Thioclava litoralis]|uniref:Uncharacterized protein n=1 Tax=Thioclava litoralis TaxID=3076557 RepID=A0ABZ1DYK6_9RHOB|nr:hypothetical protein RPE78_12855 [Thioclava sp. FTW29]